MKCQHPQGFSRRRLFYGHISIQNTASSLRMSVTAHARTIEAGRKAALVFVEEMFDVGRY
jgi:hypothetical protein